MCLSAFLFLPLSSAGAHPGCFELSTFAQSTASLDSQVCQPCLESSHVVPHLVLVKALGFSRTLHLLIRCFLVCFFFPQLAHSCDRSVSQPKWHEHCDRHIDKEPVSSQGHDLDGYRT